MVGSDYNLGKKQLNRYPIQQSNCVLVLNIDLVNIRVGVGFAHSNSLVAHVPLEVLNVNALVAGLSLVSS